MNPPKSHELDYIHFLIAAQKAFTFTEVPDVIPGMMVYHHRHHPTTLLPGCCAGILQTLKRYGESGRFVEKKEGELLDSMTRHDARQAIRREDGPCHVPLVIPMKSKEYYDVVLQILHTQKKIAL